MRRFFCILLVLAVGCGSLTGCASLRKKFTRKKKVSDRAQDFVPLLQPVEYARPEQTPLEKYKEHYTMARAYFKDVWETMGSVRSGSKQQVYVLNQLIARLRGMGELLPAEKKAVLERDIISVEDVVKEYAKPDPMRRYDLLRGTMHKVEKSFRTNFKPDAVKGDLAGS